MKAFILIIILVSLQNAAKAADSVELEVLSTATTQEMKQYNECVADQGADNSCMQDIFGDIHN